MAVPSMNVMAPMGASWRQFRTSLEESLDNLEKEIKDAADVQHVCTNEWCEAVEHAIDDFANFLFSIHEPKWMPAEESKKIKVLRRRVHDLYAEYKSVKK